MEEALGNVFSILLCSVLMFMVPLMYVRERMEYMTQINVTAETVEFVDSVRNTGIITKDMYEVYMRQVLRAGGDVKLTHSVCGVGSNQTTVVEYDRQDIEELLYTQGTDYGLRREDYFRVCVTANGGKSVICAYGGCIRNERY